MLKYLLLLLTITVFGCTYLTTSKPILKQSEFEKMIAGRFDADYVGTDTCLFRCHEHDKLNEYFKKSVHAEQIAKETALPLVNCETCHGPGSLAIENIKEVNGKKQCDYETLIDLKKLPAGAKNLTCLKCHTISSTPSTVFFRGSAHDINDVACSDCHRLHQSPLQKVGFNEQADMCLNCHKKIKIQFKALSHHPVIERKMVCTDCHNPHGSNSENLLKKDSIKEVCIRCHLEKGASNPFSHGDVIEDCTNCHNPHGSNNDNLLKFREPTLCLKCHKGHHTSSLNDSRKLYNRCSDCHSSIHGSTTPKGLLR